MENKLYKKIVELNIIESNDVLTIAVSGGPDSMALLDLLKRIKIKNEVKNLKLNVAHVNHKTRGNENIQEEMLIKRYCEIHNISFYKTDFFIKQEGNFHDQARDYRYNFFKKIARETNSNKILLAHHEDDQVETILFRIIRGSTLEGYTGMKQITEFDNHIKIVRPLINIKKSEIINYCYEFDIPYAIDSSNKSNKYTRNKLRNRVIPELKEIQPRLNHKLIQLRTYIEEVNDFVESVAYERYELCKIHYDNKELILSIKQIKKNHISIQRSLIFYAINQITSNNLELSYDKSNIIINMIGNKKPNMELDLGNDFKCIKAYDRLILKKCNDSEKTHEDIAIIRIKPEGNYQINSNLEISVNFTTDIKKRNNKTMILCYNSIEWPLYIRTRKNGDKIKIKSGHKKLKDLFIDHKIPRYERDNWPLLVNQAGDIIWVFGLKQAYTDLPLDQEQYIKIETL
ncbi:tRNA lysidine(34) synthetase TilS [Haloplasma contractile]|nr:tRNA lysidine(34) synthetase TilS [Haloplasma contractile]